jgi:exodeoxyribonuclease VII small subunit
MDQLSEKGSSSQKMSFELALDQLQQTVKKLESGELTLEESLRQFEEGVKLTRLCQEQLASAEQRVEILLKATPQGEVQVQPFTSTGRF